MNSDNPQPAETDNPPLETPKKRGGCAGCMMILLGILLFGYILIFQTPIPLKLIAGNIEKNTVIDGRRLEIKGVGGSLSRGIKIKRLLVPGEHGDTTITDLKFRYKKPTRWFTRGQFIITEISSGSAEFVVANDFFTTKEDESASDGGEPGHTSEQEQVFKEDGFFELQLLHFRNTRIRTADNSVDIRIPEIHLKGLRADSEGMSIEDFKIDSDVLDAELGKGRSVTIDGSKVTFDQRIVFAIKPAIHKSVIRDIPVSFEFSKSKGTAASRITAFDGAMEQVDFGDQHSFVRFERLMPSKYMRFDGLVMPGELNLTARQQGEMVTLEAGSFVIGKTTFSYEAREFHEDADEAIVGTTTAGPLEITASIIPDKSDNAWPPILVELGSKPEAPRNEILAQLYHGKDYASLTEEEKAAVDKLK